MALYGVILLMAAVSYTILQYFIIAANGKNSLLATAVGKRFKGKLSLVMYLIAIPFSFLNHYVSGAIYVLVALIWLIPDRRIERTIKGRTVA